MQISNSDESATVSTNNIEEESVIDASGKTLDLQVLDKRVNEGDCSSIEGLYLYKNTFNLIPRAVGGLSKLKTLKFFGNEVNLFPAEFGNLVNLERLQVKISLPGLTGLPLQKLKGLRELELSKAPPRPSAFPLLADIVGLERLTKLSVCHFSIRYLPSEIGCLTCLEYLDLSHNKLKNLPAEITHLSALITLKVANNKLVEVPSDLSSLQRLEHLDLSNNRLTSLGSLDLDSMHNLRILNLQYNKFPSFSQIPQWIRCDLEGNDEVMTNAEMDVLESAVTELPVDSITDEHIDTADSLSTHMTGSSSNRSIPKHRKGRRKGRYVLQQRARQKRLNCSRSRKCDNSAHVSTQIAIKTAVSSESLPEDSLDNKGLAVDDDGSEQVDENCVKGKEAEDNCNENDDASDNSCSTTQSKRHSVKDLNPKPSKSRRPIDMHLNMSSKYSAMSFCSIEDCLPDGFYDAGRDRPFLPLNDYDKNVHLGSREVIVMDRERDEELDAITLCAKALLFRLNQIHGSTKLDMLHVASLLALFVSSHFGGTDKSGLVYRERKSVSGSNYNKPFVCTCPTGTHNNDIKSAKQSINSAEDAVLLGLCEKSIQLVKARRNSIVVPIGTLQFGVCRHRALLLKYLCDRVEPRVPCELVRGYLDFAPHAWNVIVVKRGDSEVRMVVDACRPHDIREETDPEYYYRYIPMSRINSDASLDVDCSFPSLSTCEEVKEEGSSTLIQCNLGSVEAAAKVRILDLSGSSADEVRNFEFNCIGEVRLLSVLKHPCIVKVLGHQISTKWLPSSDGTPENRVLQSAIFMEHVKGGSLKDYIEKLARSGEKHVDVELALQIARDVAWALSEIHSKDVIHRDLKSENVLIDLDDEKSDGKPVVKLCDFDRAVPLRSSLHTCCIGHMGIPPPDVCVGTPRWMAPEVYRTIHDRSSYGLEVDLWSFGCLLLELLTLQVPYAGLRESEIHELLSMGKRPLLTDELEAMGPAEDTKTNKPESEEYKKEKTLRFLIDIYRKCTKDDPLDRPTADRLYRILADFSNSTTAEA
ncbi:putative dual-specificity kinase TKL-Pl-2 family [Helianthus anomalus]